MIVTFCGHKDISDTAALHDRLLDVLRSLISEGADTFLLGGYGAFDTLAASAVQELKTEFPQIRATLVLPYLDRDYNRDLYDDSIYPPLENVPRRFAISKRNEWMVDQADVIVAFVTHGWGGAASTLRYSERKKKRVISLAE